MKRTIWLLRHGMREDFKRPEWRAAAERPYDPPLADEGRVQARDTARFLRDRGVEVIYSSPFLRALETASIVADVLDVPIRVEHGLSEILRADWIPEPPRFLPPEIMKQEFPQIDATYRSRAFPDYPEVDNSGQVGARCSKAIAGMLADNWSTALWVGHGASVGGVGMALQGHVRDVCFNLCGLTGWQGVPDNWTRIHSGTDHLSITEDGLKFHQEIK